jgi:hypothetical protein
LNMSLAAAVANVPQINVAVEGSPNEPVITHLFCVIFMESNHC